jgi:hypothetical protein
MFIRKNQKEIRAYLHSECFDNLEFARHVKEVSLKTKINEEIVRDVLEGYFARVSYAINTITKFHRKINIYGFLKLFVLERKRKYNILKQKNDE